MRRLLFEIIYITILYVFIVKYSSFAIPINLVQLSTQSIEYAENKQVQQVNQNLNGNSNAQIINDQLDLIQNRLNKNSNRVSQEEDLEYSYFGDNQAEDASSNQVSSEKSVQELKSKFVAQSDQSLTNDSSQKEEIEQEQDLENRNDQELYDRLLNIESNIPYLNINFTDLDSSK